MLTSMKSQPPISPGLAGLHGCPYQIEKLSVSLDLRPNWPNISAWRPQVALWHTESD